MVLLVEESQTMIGSTYLLKLRQYANEINGNSNSHFCLYLGNYLNYSIEILQRGCPSTPLDAQTLQPFSGAVGGALGAVGGTPGAIFVAPWMFLLLSSKLFELKP